MFSNSTLPRLVAAVN